MRPQLRLELECKSTFENTTSLSLSLHGARHPTHSEKDPIKRVREGMEAFAHSKSKMAQEIEQTLSERKQSVQYIYTTQYDTYMHNYYDM